MSSATVISRGIPCFPYMKSQITLFEMASRLCHSEPYSASMAPKDSTMRVAVAGTNELALLMAHYIVTETSYQLVILSRHVCKYTIQ
jgi:hypothetical protein